MPDNNFHDQKSDCDADAEPKKNRPKPGEFGFFLDGAVNGFVQRPYIEGDDDLKRTWEHLFLPRKMKAQFAEMQDDLKLLRKKVASDQVLRDGRSKRAAALRIFVIIAYKKFPSASQPEVAMQIDKALADKRVDLSSVAPRSWTRLNLPRLLSDVFADPKVAPRLKKNVKSYLSKHRP